MKKDNLDKMMLRYDAMVALGVEVIHHDRGSIVVNGRDIDVYFTGVEIQDFLQKLLTTVHLDGVNHGSTASKNKIREYLGLPLDFD